MSTTQAALYARVSSDVQQEARTIESQVADLRAGIARRGLQLAPELAFVDDGYSGATQVASGAGTAPRCRRCGGH